LPTLIWGLERQASPTGLGWIWQVRGRRAEPCVAQRVDRAPSEDWLPKFAADHCITSYPVGPMVRTPIPHACGEEACEDETLLRSGLVWPLGGTVIIHPGRGAAELAAPGTWLCLHRCPFRHKPGAEIAPQRNDQLARQRDDGNAFGALAGVGGAGAEPAAERAVRLMAQP
jgi:hypothetical protein